MLSVSINFNGEEIAIVKEYCKVNHIKIKTLIKEAVCEKVGLNIGRNQNQLPGIKETITITGTMG